MVLATEQPALGNAFQMFASAAGPMPLEKASQTESEELSYQMVEGIEAAAVNPTAGPINETAGREEAKPPSPTQNLHTEIQQLKMKISKHRAENISLDIKASQTDCENEELRVELSRVRMALAKEKAVSSKRKQKYDELLEDVQLGSDKLSKKLVKYKRRGDELELQLKTDLEDQKTFWQEINQRLLKENELSLNEITDLKEGLEEANAVRAQEKQEAKNTISTLEDSLEDALQEAAERQIQFERVQVENSKLRKEKTEMTAAHEQKISKMGEQGRSPAPNPEDDFSNEDFLRMMQETMGDGMEDYDQ